jgi:hypothetical protein
VQYGGTYLSTIWINVFYMIYANTLPVDADLSSIATTLRAAWLSAFGPYVSTNCSLTQVIVQDVSRNPGAVGTNTIAASGSSGAGGAPANVSLAISKRVARRYRGGHPRLYMPGIPTNVTTDGRTLTTTALANWQAAATAWFTACNAANSTSTGACKLANVGYYYVPTPHAKPIPRPSPIVELISAVTVNNRLDSQRGRLG